MDRTYDIFEKLPDGAFVWREAVAGHDRAIERLKQLAIALQSKKEFLLMYVPTKATVAVINAQS
jgi:hypothetical protein